MITVAVEGDTDVPFVARLCEASGLDIGEPVVAQGKDNLAPYIAGFARSGKGSPHLVVRDLDLDGECAVEWVREHGPPKPGRYFALRLAVRAVEAWFLADRKAAAAALHVAERTIPRSPDDEPDPKLTIVNLARASSKRRIREAIVPPSGLSRKAAPGYEGWLLGAAARWRLERARANSPSLARAYRRLTALREAWEAKQP